MNKNLEFAIIAIICFCAVPVNADTLSKKICILQSAQKLPQIQGLSIRGMKIKDIDKKIAVNYFAKGAYDKASSHKIASDFGFLTVKFLDEIAKKSEYREVTENALFKNLTETFDIEIEFSAATQIATMQFYCGVSQSQNIKSESLGIVK